MRGGVNAAEFERLVREYSPMVRSLIYHITRSPDDVDDIAQDVFLRAFQAMPTFRGGSFRAFLGRIARNRCYDLLRQRRASSASPFLALAADDWPSAERSPEETVVAREAVAEVIRVVGQLSQVDREILLLRHVHEFTYDEIAAVLGMRSGAVRTRISRARQKVVAALERGQRDASGSSQLG
ncbi:MAG: RNA polymerase sigma factor [Alicyclobacillaceae bacterium]|nr:RNA polymerase sigma factor [Alicyclobacillaceae bacterium]